MIAANGVWPVMLTPFLDDRAIDWPSLDRLVDWYLEAGQGMGEVLTMADQRQGYTLSDRATFLAYKGKIDLKVLTEGDKRLFNPYGVIAVNPAKYPHTKFQLAEKFIDYLVSPEGQGVIKNYRRGGDELFFLYSK